jgi:hypothetical protein
MARDKRKDYWNEVVASAPVCKHLDFCAQLLRCGVTARHHAHVAAQANEFPRLRCHLLLLLLDGQEEKLRLRWSGGIAMHGSTVPQQQV